MYLHHCHTFPKHCDSCPAPGLCEQHQEPPSSAGAWLHTAGTPGCVAGSAAGAETSWILSVTESVNCSATLPMPSAWLSLLIPQQHPGVCMVLILRPSLGSPKPFAQLAGWSNWKSLFFFQEFFLLFPTCRLRICLCVCSCAGVGGRLCRAPSGMALGHRGLGLPPG